MDLPASRGTHRKSAPATLRRLREQSGLSVEEMAERLDVMPAELSAWEAGALKPARDTVEWVRFYAAVHRRERQLLDATDGVKCEWLACYSAMYAAVKPLAKEMPPPPGPELAAHVAACPVCATHARVDAQLPPSPRPPLWWVEELIWWRSELPFAGRMAAMRRGSRSWWASSP